MSGWRGNNQVWEDEKENGDTMTCEEEHDEQIGRSGESNADLFNLLR